jgi:membrane-bound lytic murein transglycosylase F
MITTLRQWILAIASTCLVACGGGDQLSKIEERGVLRLVTRNGPNTYYVDKGEAAGFEYQLVSQFAEELGVELNIHIEYSAPAIMQYMRRGQADIAASSITVTATREQEFLFSRPYHSIDPQVLYLSGTSKPRKLADLLDGHLVVAAGSSHAETLNFLKELEPTLTWEEIEEADPDELMELVESGAANYTIIDSNDFIANRSFYPRVRVGYSIDRTDQLAWMFPPGNAYESLRQKANAFLERMEASGELAQLKEQQFGHAWGVNPVNAQTFNRNMERKLPQYEDLIQEVAEEYQLDWHLLAAIAYQESHWNPKARSPTGVRGMMMLTRNTAQEMGIENRLEAAQSLRGGARYFKKVKRLLPKDIIEPDRTWFALAGYNIGRGHLEDARVITQRQGGDPHIWADVAERLPLLQKKAFYKKTRHGYARGSEPVTYVKNIRHYYSILSWRDINRDRPLPPINTEPFLLQLVRISKMSAL